MKEVLFNNKEYSDTLGHLDELLQDAEKLSDVDNKVLVYQILQYFDSIHREPLSRIFNALDDYPTLKDQIIQDPTTSKLLSLYDLISEEQVNNHVDGRSVAFIPAHEVTLLHPPKKKDWLELGDVTSFENEKLYAKNYEKVNFLISRIGADVYAIENQCDGSFLPIDQGKIEDYLLICPWHGCKYDIRTGQSVDPSDKKLETFPVEIEEGGLLKVEIAY
ncbi:MAG: nitrite reductase/ring-hydroxylating ferredoxin subunit [Saprospiraceae bacterium]|jgi:nitrite reductase/ring-hydroxylating ferredoxin subunit